MSTLLTAVEDMMHGRITMDQLAKRLDAIVKEAKLLEVKDFNNSPTSMFKATIRMSVGELAEMAPLPMGNVDDNPKIEEIVGKGVKYGRDIHPDSTGGVCVYITSLPMKTIQINGYVNTIENVEETHKVKVPTGELDSAGNPIFVEEEVKMVVPKNVRVPKIKDKVVPDPDFEANVRKRAEELPALIAEMLKAKIIGEALSLRNDYAGPHRKQVDISKMSRTRKWDDKANGVIDTLSDEVLEAIGFDPALLKRTDTLMNASWVGGGSTFISLDGFTPMFTPTFTTKRSNRMLEVCAMSGKVIPSGNVLKRALYLASTKGGSYLLPFDSQTFSKFLNGSLKNINFYFSGNTYTVVVLTNDLRGYHISGYAAVLRSCIGSNITAKTILDVFSSTSYTAPVQVSSMYDKYPDYNPLGLSGLRGSYISEYIKYAKLGRFTACGISFNPDGSYSVDPPCVPELSTYLPVPVSGEGITRLYFGGSNGFGPLGFLRDGHPVPSVDPKPGYRYYGVEIELENPEGNMTSDIVTGIYSPEMVKYGFVYGRDGSLVNGMEFRSSPQGFGTMRNNLEGFFKVIKSRIPLDYNIYAGSPLLGEQETSALRPTIGGEPVWDKENNRWTFVEKVKKPKTDKRFTGPSTWVASERCGLHIHVSRSALTELQLGKIINFVYSPSNKDFIVMIAGRESKRYAEISTPPPVTIDKTTGKIKINKKACSVTPTERAFVHPKTGEIGRDASVPRFRVLSISPEGRKYTGVNCEHQHTIEFRIFKGADTAKEVITKLEFVDSLIEFTSSKSGSPVSLSDCLSKDKYIDWLMNTPAIRKQYPDLVEFILSNYSVSGMDKIKSRLEDRKDTIGKLKEILASN